MKISYTWLREFVEFHHTPSELADLLTRIGHNVDSIAELGGKWTKVVVGQVVSCEHIQGSDHLTLCRVDIGSGELLGVVCGAPNVAQGQVVPVALIGAELPGGLKISERKVKGVLSQGMICSDRELGISEEGSGIMVLSAPSQSSASGFILGKPLEDYLGRRDWIFDAEITINRPDCLSHLGVARELSAVLGSALKIPPFQPTESGRQTSELVTVEILAPERCPRYSARVMTGVSVAPSPIWMQERLRNLGVRPISNVVDATNYVMLELGHPLHAFDYHLVADGRIIVRAAAFKEKFTTLDGKEHTLRDNDLLIADRRGGIAMAGVMGGLNSEIKDDTKDVLLECAYFERVGIRFSSRDHAVNSESSHRFERGADPEMTLLAVNRCAYMIQNLAGGEVLRGVVDNYPKPWESRKLTLRPARTNSLLATNLTPAQMAEHLESLGCIVGCGEFIEATPPSWRHDLEREIDLIEEIARLNGYDNIATAQVSQVPLEINVLRERETRIIERVKSALVESGFREAITLSLISAQEASALPGFPTPARLINPISEDMSTLRPSLLPTLLSAARRSRSSGIKNIRLFEWGDCFWDESGKVAEGKRLSGVLTGNIRPESWLDDTRSLRLLDLKGILEQFARRISLDKFGFIYYDIPEIMESGGKILIGESSDHLNLGWFGRLKPEFAGWFDLDQPVWCFELDGELLLKHAGVEPRYQSLPRYPAAHRDLSFVIKDEVPAGALDATLRSAGGELLESVEVFDFFRGKGIPEGSKSLAFHLAFRSSERTLSDAEVDRMVSRMVQSAQETNSAALRST